MNKQKKDGEEEGEDKHKQKGEEETRRSNKEGEEEVAARRTHAKKQILPPERKRGSAPRSNVAVE